MKLSKSELFSLIVGLIFLVASTAIYLTYGNKHTISAKQMSIWKEEDAEGVIKEAETILETLETAPTEALLADAKIAIKRVTDRQARQQLNERITAVETAQVQLKSAEEAVLTLEAEQTFANIDSAQTAVNSLTIASKKTELQNRIEAVRANLTAQQVAAEQAQATPPAQPVAPAIIVSDIPAE